VNLYNKPYGDGEDKTGNCRRARLPQPQLIVSRWTWVRFPSLTEESRIRPYMVVSHKSERGFCIVETILPYYYIARRVGTNQSRRAATEHILLCSMRIQIHLLDFEPSLINYFDCPRNYGILYRIRIWDPYLTPEINAGLGIWWGQCWCAWFFMISQLSKFE